MKSLKYALGICFLVLGIILIVLGIISYAYSQNIVIAATLIVAGAILIMAFKGMRIKGRQECSFDKYGNAVKKYSSLSQAERKAIDMTVMARNESIMSEAEFNAMLNTGVKNPDKELKSLIGLDKVKDVEGMKKLLNANKKVFEGCGISLGTYLSSLTPDNIKESKKVLQEQIEKENMTNYQTFKNLTEKCWNKEKKCFTKPDGVEQKIFDVIKNTKTKGQWKKALKYGGVTAGVMGALTLGYKMMTSN